VVEVVVGGSFVYPSLSCGALFVTVFLSSVP
jgi:hypothetical protein